MYKKLLIIAVTGLFSLPAFAADGKAYVLKDGSTVHVFKDGKMSMEDKMGRPARMK